MDQSLSFAPDAACDIGSDTVATVAAILPVFASNSPDHARVVLVEARAAGFDLASPEARPLLMEMIGRALAWLDNEGQVVPTLHMLACLGPAAALAGFDVLFNALFPDGVVAATEISDSAVVVLARLAAEAGYLDDGLAFFSTARAGRDPARYLPLVHAARCHMLGLNGSIAPLWSMLPDPACGNAFNPQTWRAMARTCAAVGDWNSAVATLVSGMLLPVPAHAKAGLGADFAQLAVYLHARGQTRLIERDARVWQALTTAPELTAEALATLDAWPDDELHALYDDDLRDSARAWLGAFVAQG